MLIACIILELEHVMQDFWDNPGNLQQKKKKKKNLEKPDFSLSNYPYYLDNHTKVFAAWHGYMEWLAIMSL